MGLGIRLGRSTAGKGLLMSTVTVRFHEVTSRGKVTTFCRDCRKKITKQFTVMNTVNPYNTVGEGADRRPKTLEEVQRDVKTLRDEQERDLLARGSYCRDCGEKYPWPGPPK